ncbi:MULTISPECIES: class I SAM-dependent DNA methyltransferase, partial [unclassified Mesorhizobium]|uniref:class I SAM-dependent DNA methyltransferase n=1 Tax=unclassified Mesorhizobium TaxID=325217 RepID=UPI003015713F
RSSPSRETTAENSNSERSSFQGSDHCELTNSTQKLNALGSSWKHAPSEPTVFDARTGYDRIATAYDKSSWRRFWKKNEYPIVKKIILRLFHKHSFQNALDIGAGTGFYSRLLESYSKNVVGIDISHEMTKIAQSKSKSIFLNIDFLKYRSDQEYDFALSARTMSHVRRMDDFLNSINKNVSEGGSVIITDVHPKHNYYKTRFELKNEIVEIETYKHEMMDIFNYILDKMSDQVIYKEFDFRNLPDKWISTEFRSVFNSIDPIFYILMFKKNGKFDENTYRYMHDTLKFSSVTNAN